MPDVNLSEFEALSRPKRPRCPIGEALSVLPEDEAAQLVAAVATDRHVITASAVVTWLKRRDLSANVSAVTSHRRDTCTCTNA
jgi:hypothetical protein